MAGGRVSNRRSSSSQATTKQEAMKESKSSPKRRRASGRTALATSQGAKEQHETDAAAIDEGIEMLDTYINALKNMTKLNQTQRTQSPDLGKIKHGKRDWASTDVLEVMSEVIDENPRPNLEFALGVLGAAEIPKQSNERNRNQGSRALTSGLRNRSIQRKKEAIEKQREEERKKKEKERLERERKEKERKEKEKLERQKKKEEEERLRKEQEKKEKERLEKERQEKEQKEKQKKEKQKLEQERLRKLELEKERLEKEKLETQRLEKERLKRLEKQKERELITEEKPNEIGENRRTSRRRRGVVSDTNDDPVIKARSRNTDYSSQTLRKSQETSIAASTKLIMSPDQREELEAEIEKAFPEPEPEPPTRSFARPVTGARRGSRFTHKVERTRLSDEASNQRKQGTENVQPATSKSKSDKQLSEDTGKRKPSGENEPTGQDATVKQKGTTKSSEALQTIQADDDSKAKTHKNKISSRQTRTEAASVSKTEENESKLPGEISDSTKREQSDNNQLTAQERRDKNVRDTVRRTGSVRKTIDKSVKDKTTDSEIDTKFATKGSASTAGKSSTKDKATTRTQKLSEKSTDQAEQQMSLSQLAIAASQVQAAEKAAMSRSEKNKEPEESESSREEHGDEEDEKKTINKLEEEKKSTRARIPTREDKESSEITSSHKRRANLKRGKSDLRDIPEDEKRNQKYDENEIVMPRRTKRARRADKEDEDRIEANDKNKVRQEDGNDAQASVSKEMGKEEANKGEASRERRMSSRRSTGIIWDMSSHLPQTRLRRESSHLQDPSYMFDESDPFLLDCFAVWKTINQAKISIPFREPVLAKDAPGYFDIIKHPMDLSTVLHHLQDKSIRTPVQFMEEMTLICDNAMKFNDKETDLYDLAVELRTMIRKNAKPIVKKWRQSQGLSVQADDESSDDDERGKRGRGRRSKQSRGKGGKGRGKSKRKEDESDASDKEGGKKGARGKSKSKGSAYKKTKDSGGKRTKRGRPAADEDDAARKKRRTSGRR